MSVDITWAVCREHGVYKVSNGCYLCNAEIRGRGGPDPAQPVGLEGTLAERGARYGDFTEHAKITDALLGVLMGDSLAGRFATSWGLMKPFQRQALRTICVKLARIANGDPDYIDDWRDIQGYAKLVEDRLLR